MSKGNSRKGGRIVTPKDFEKYAESAGEYFNDYDNVGLRVVNSEYSDYNAGVGDVLDHSYVWDEGERTGEELEGVSAIDASNNRWSSVHSYSGDRILVLGTNSGVSYGEDPAEIVMRSPRVLRVIKLR